MDPIFDGECHAISEEYAYIAKRIEIPGREIIDLGDVDEQLLKYCEYLTENDKKRVLGCLMSIFTREVRNLCTDDSYQIIYRPPWVSSILNQYGTLVLKFKRAEKDNLEKEYE